MAEHILVAVDGSDHADRAVDFAAEIARCFGCPMTILNVAASATPVPMMMGSYAELEQIWTESREALEDAGRQIVERAKRRATDAGLTDVHTRVAVGSPALVITQVAADLGADVIVMGRRGLGDLEGLLLGSVSHKVAHVADATVITVR